MTKLDNTDIVKLNSAEKQNVYNLLIQPVKETLLSVDRVSLLGLGHPCYADWLMREFPNIKQITILENESIRFLYADLEKTHDVVYVKNGDWVGTIKNVNVASDAVIMNTDYGTTVYLQAMEAVINHMMNNNSICSALSPIGWLQDPLGEDKSKSNIKKYKEILNSLVHLIPVSAKQANSLFGINRGDLGVYIINKGTKTPFDYKALTKNNQIVEKIKIYANKDNVMLHSSPEGDFTRTYSGVFGVVHSHLGDRTRFVSDKRELWIKESQKRTAKVITDFSSTEERDNFFKVLNSPLFRYYASRIKVNQRQPWQFVPWLGKSIHPRTGRIGYQDEWTNDDLYKFFNILPDEQMAISMSFS